MKLFNEKSTCFKCGSSDIESEYWDGMYPYSGYMCFTPLSDGLPYYGKMCDTAHERECIKRTCLRCEYDWSESVMDKSQDLSVLQLPTMAFNALVSEGIETTADLTKLTEVGVLKIAVLGKKMLTEIKSRLAARGLSLAKSPPWTPPK